MWGNESLLRRGIIKFPSSVIYIKKKPTSLPKRWMDWLELRLWLHLRAHIITAIIIEYLTACIKITWQLPGWYLLKMHVVILCRRSFFFQCIFKDICVSLLTIWNDCGKSPGQTWSVWRTSWLLWVLTCLSLPGSRRARRRRRVLTQGTLETEKERRKRDKGVKQREEKHL